MRVKVLYPTPDHPARHSGPHYGHKAWDTIGRLLKAGTSFKFVEVEEWNMIDSDEYAAAMRALRRLSKYNRLRPPIFLEI